jgi:DNA (cytosine-5)-methyltransferase 3A
LKGKVHKISVEQAERLQTWTKGYTNVPGVSNTAKYEMIGNGWTVDVIAHFLKCAKK